MKIVDRPSRASGFSQLDTESKERMIRKATSTLDSSEHMNRDLKTCHYKRFHNIVDCSQITWNGDPALEWTMAGR